MKVTAGNGNGMGMPLTIAAQLLPTPKASDGERGRDKARVRPDLKGRELATVLRDQLPTPRTCSAMAAPVNSKGNLEGNRFPNLETVIGRMLPTPTTRDHKDGSQQACANVAPNGLLGREIHQAVSSPLTGDPMYLNPSFVEEMMGFPVGWTA